MTSAKRVLLAFFGAVLDDLPTYARPDSDLPGPLHDPTTATCPSCLGLPERESVERLGDDVTHLLTLCEVCERSGRVSRELARALWNASPAAA